MFDGSSLNGSLANSAQINIIAGTSQGGWSDCNWQLLWHQQDRLEVLAPAATTIKNNHHQSYCIVARSIERSDSSATPTSWFMRGEVRKVGVFAAKRHQFITRSSVQRLSAETLSKLFIVCLWRTSSPLLALSGCLSGCYWCCVEVSNHRVSSTRWDRKLPFDLFHKCLSLKQFLFQSLKTNWLTFIYKFDVFDIITKKSTNWIILYTFHSHYIGWILPTIYNFCIVRWELQSASLSPGNDLLFCLDLFFIKPLSVITEFFC